MSKFQFGLGSGHLPRAAARAAAQEGAQLVNYTEPRGEKRHWFEADNYGSPFDDELAKRVLAAVHAASPKSRQNS